MVCPHCGSQVVPWRGAGGELVCPACSNTGQAKAAPAPSAGGWTATPSGTPQQPAWGVPPATPAPNADGAVLTLVLGILALAVPYVGIVLGIIALVVGRRAAAAIDGSGGQLQGRGMVKAGRILAVVGIVLWAVALLVIASAVVFVLVSNLGAAPSEVPDVAFNKDSQDLTLTVVQVRSEDRLLWSDLEVGGTASCAVPFGAVEPGDVISCSGTGTVEVVHLPTATLLYMTTFV